MNFLSELMANESLLDEQKINTQLREDNHHVQLLQEYSK